MPSKLTDDTIIKRHAATTKEIDALAARRKRAEETVASFDADRTELDAELAYLSSLAEARGLDLTPATTPEEEDIPVESWV